MKRILLLSVSFGVALVFIVACAQVSTPTQAPTAVEQTIEEAPTETLPPSPTATATEVEETEVPATATPTEAPAEEETADPGAVDDVEALIIDQCSGCHAVDRVFNADKSESQWESTIDRMVDYGAVVSETEKNLMIDWLISRIE